MFCECIFFWFFPSIWCLLSSNSTVLIRVNSCPPVALGNDVSHSYRSRQNSVPTSFLFTSLFGLSPGIQYLWWDHADCVIVMVSWGYMCTFPVSSHCLILFFSFEQNIMPLFEFFTLSIWKSKNILFASVSLHFVVFNSSKALTPYTILRILTPR